MFMCKYNNDIKIMIQFQDDSKYRFCEVTIFVKFKNHENLYFQLYLKL